MTVAQWSTTASLNVLSSGTSGTGGTNIDEGMARSDVNNAMRDMMSQIATWRTAATIGGFFSQTVIGHTAALSIGGNSDNFEVFGTTAATGGVAIGMFNATAGTGPHLDFYRSKDAALATATVVASGDNLGALNWYGAQQTGTFATQTMAAQIRAEVDGAVTSGGSGDMPGRLVFATTADGGSAVVDRFTIASSGTFTFTYNDAGAAIGPTIDLFRDSASPAASDVMASIDFNGRDSAANKQLYARLYSTIRVATSGSEDGEFRIAATVSGSLTDVYVYSQGTHALTGALTVSSTTYLAGVTRIGQNSVDDPGQGNANTGVGISSSQIWVANNASSGTAVLGVGRGNSVPDGTLVSFTRGGTSQGSISVSSTVVSYNTFMGAHDSRLWSARLAEWQDKFIPRGSILSSVNEMVNWLAVEYVDHAGEKHQNEALIEERGLSLGDTTIVHLTRRETEEYEDFDISTIIGENGGSVEVQIPITRTREVVVEYDVEGIAVALANDQLPAFMVSEIEDDERVYGVMAWQTGPLDYNVSALGAYLVRVHRDEVQTVIDTLALPGKCVLISSRGDGTGKVQRDRNGDIDDVFRMRTVAKVTAAIRRPVNFAGDLAYEDGSVLLPASIHCG